MDLNKETIQKLTRLCRIDCTEDEQISILEDLKKIISYIEVLQKINTDNVPPCNHVLEEIHNVFREDVVGETLNQELFLNNAPAHSGKFIRVPPVIKS